MSTKSSSQRDITHLVEHDVRSLVLQRVVGIALGYEDLVDHDRLRHDPALTGKSTLNRLELGRAEPGRYHRIAHDPAAIEGLFVDVFLDAPGAAPGQIVLDLDAIGISARSVDDLVGAR
ncbi:hypothetical protein AA0498_0850 [Acidomonas methanolica]|uniref:Transposase n=1 Tax=Acidomonas methanolica NBRC 104435 TaxID=1231351 RepID=A0A023DAF8_ACIMT|nr:DDE family transposase [Acidomonas methanolica]GAJ30675.1 transposase [Acidomonas methanolica NBRC 104435]GBQ48876.1 hypothetical protein AA0498_0850 [Acidomonas methanolica]GEK99650.1 hypothetical protein AME01nite_21490 [Acidomonas methanolica NBRC 104435]